MQALLAGFIIGTGFGMAAWVLIAIALTAGTRRWEALVARFPDGTALPMLMVGAALVVHAGGSALGLALGAVYWAVQDNAQNGLGSPAWGFSLFFLVLAALGWLFAVVAQPSWWRPAGLLALTLAGAFGWMLPHLAEA